MRQTTFTTLVLLLCFAFQSYAQVTITKDNFPREANFTDQIYVKSDAEVVVPSEGSNQMWDYSGIEGATLFEQEYQDASNDADFPNALNYRRRDASFQQFTIPYDAYENVDETGYYPLGSKFIETSYPLTAISGGADDVLRFPPSIDIIDGDNYYVQFPLEYQKQWESTYSGVVNFELTVAAFGLNQTPGFNKRISNMNREVVGYGELVIPLEDGSPSHPVEALVIKSSFTHVDSFFVGGAPAPVALLNAFGIVQGQISESLSYSFYTPGSGSVILFVDVDENEYYYRPKALPPQPTVIITKDNFPRGGSFTEIGYFMETDILDAPTEGTGQVWDYSFLTPDSLITQVYTDASNDPNFSGALNYSSGNISFNGFPISRNQYEAIDEEGWYHRGRTTEDVSYPITAISGGADDVLRFPDSVIPYGGRLDRLQFPVAYGKTWTQSQIESTEFELTVAAFGLNQVPGVNVRTVTESRTIVGEGKLIIPAEDGTPDVPIDALLLKVEHTYVDSVFLGGAPAPATLLGAFGLTQGAATTQPIRYIFYSPNFASNVLNVNPASGTFFYRPAATTSSTAPIVINHDRVCDVPAVGLSQVTVAITGGLAPYQVSGNFNGEVAEEEVFSFIMEDGETTYEISVVDAAGNESQVLEDVLPCTKLPVELLFFEGEAVKEGNYLQWGTASELNNQFYTLSYSTDGQNFTPLQKIDGNGTTNTSNTYEFLHRNAPNGIAYYQLIQTDLDGTIRDIGTISIQRGESSNIAVIEVKPVPTHNQLNISFGFAQSTESSTLTIHDLLGRIVKNQILDNTTTSLQLNVTDLSTGTYILKVENSLETLTTRFVKF